MKNGTERTTAAPVTKEEAKKLAQTVVDMLGARAHSHGHVGAAVLGLYGNLGAGKTTFMQFFGEALGVREKILSPTFVIEKIYKIEHPSFDHLVHIDAYRLEDENELRTLGWDEIVRNPRNIIAVEWADKIPGLMPAEHLKLRFSHHGEESRIIEITER